MAEEAAGGERVLHVGEEEHHGKKSMFKRVKDRAKKMKETIEKKIHDGEHEEEETEPDVHGAPEVHRAPDVHEAPEVHRAPEGHGEGEEEEDEGEQDVHGAPTYESSVVSEAKKSPEKISGDRVNFRNTGPLEEYPQAPKDRLESTFSGNYQTKVDDSTNTGEDEAGILPSFQEMKIHDEPESKQLHTGPTSAPEAHDQFSSDPPETKKTDSALETFEQTKFESVPEQSEVESVPEIFNNQAEKNKHEPVPENVSGGEESFTEKIYGQVASVPEQSKVESVPEQSKFESLPESFDDQAEKNKREPVPENASGGEKKYTEMIYGQVASKLGYGDNGSATPAVEGQRETDQKQTGVVTEKPGPLDGKATEKRVSIKDSVMEKLKPGEEDKALSEVITEKFHAKKEDSSESDGVSPGKATGNGSDEPATGYLGMLKGAVTSIFGRTVEAPESPVSENNRNQPAAEDAKID